MALMVNYNVKHGWCAHTKDESIFIVLKELSIRELHDVYARIYKRFMTPDFLSEFEMLVTSAEQRAKGIGGNKVPYDTDEERASAHIKLHDRLISSLKVFGNIRLYDLGVLSVHIKETFQGQTIYSIIRPRKGNLDCYFLSELIEKLDWELYQMQLETV
jgi:hypothetical protein